MIYDQTWPALMPRSISSENAIAIIILCLYWFEETIEKQKLGEQDKLFIH